MKVKKLTMRLLLVVALVSSFSYAIAAKSESKKKKSRFEQLELFNKVLHIVESQYYREVDTGKLIEGAIKGMMDTLDPHSAFLNGEVFTKMQSDTSGEFGGLGIEVTQKDGYVYVITPIDDTPAYKAGIKPKDKIVEIDHEPILGLTLDEAVDKMRGKVGQKISLGIVREGAESIKYYDIKREKIKVKPVKSFLVSDNYAYIKLSQFQKRSASSIMSAMKKLEKKTKKKGGIKGIILDLRSNPGGLLDQAVDVSSIFLKEGVVVSTESRDKNNKDIRYVKKKMNYKNTTTPMVVLINGSSASASEIVAGALQDHGRAIVAGSQSFGKGSVQTVAQIDEDNGMKLTIAQYMTPKNRKIQAKGIKPDVKLENVDFEEYDKIVQEESFIREKDLKNHLTATIETPEEKKLRKKREKEERAKRIAEIKRRKAAKKKKKKDDEEKIFTKYDPNKDFQVIQAVKLLQTAQFIKTKI
jgi:carboxyl-terminal processing protease